MSGSSDTAMRTSDFIATIGVNAHIQDPTSSYATSDVLAQMQYLGIVNMRVSDYSGTQLSEYTALGEAGIKFDAVTVIAPQNPIDLATEMADLNEIAPYVVSVEGPNEVNTDPVTYNGLTGAAAADAFQTDLYNAVEADPALAGVQVLPFSLSVGGSLTGYGDENAYATEANIHGYASQGVPPYYYLNYAVSSVTTVTGKPVVISETGYYTYLDGNSGVTQDVQAKWLMDVLLQDAADRIADTYLYQLEDGSSDEDSQEGSYGLFNSDGTPKQSAVDIHNLTTILADTGTSASTFTPAAFTYTVTGLNPDYGFQTLFAKSNGDFDIALWSEPQFYDAVTGTEAAVTPSSVTVSLGGTYNVAVYDPVIGTSPIETETAVSSITVALATDPLIIEVSPITSTTTTTFGTATVLGSGPDTLALHIAEDAYLGNAEFTVWVDGVQIGGVQTVTALQDQGQTQEFDVLGNFAPGQHAVGISFVNDAYGGSASTDRNLYLDSATINSQTTIGATFEIYGDTTLPFIFDGPGTQFPLPAPAATTLGSGADTLVLQLAEDYYLGDAEFTVAVDGVQIGGIQTASMLHGQGAQQEFDILANLAAGQHTLAISFLNDAYGGSASLDRNLYLDSATINGQTIAGTTSEFDTASTQSFTFTEPGATATTELPVSAITASASSTPAHQGQSILFDLSLSQPVTVSTTQGSPTLALSTGATATYDAADSTATTLAFTSTVGAGQSSTDLAVTALSLNGAALTGATGTAFAGGSLTATTGAATGIVVATATPTVTLGTGADTLALAVAEDAYGGDAQFTISVDGTQIGGTQTALALRSAGQTQTFDVLGIFAAGQHVVSIDFLNDNYGGGAALDRNVYVTSSTLDGTAISGGSVAVDYNGPGLFTFVAPSH